MKDWKNTWDYYFGAICSIRFHPKNDVNNIPEELEWCGLVADQMMKERDKRWRDN